PMLVLGAGALARPDGKGVLKACRDVAETFKLVKKDWNGWNLLHNAAARVGGLDVGFVPGKAGLDVGGMINASRDKALDLLFLLGVDELNMDLWGDKTFMVYIGHHGDAGAQRADVILPGAAYTEKDATYVNTEGRVQHGWQAVFPPGQAKEDWKIIRALSARLGKDLPYDTLEELRERMAKCGPQFAAPGALVEAPWGEFAQYTKAASKLSKEPFDRYIRNFYMTDPISRNSKTMAECTVVARDGLKKVEAAA
ncbi:MAG: molybdopterin-dependent oxidoreductase, partial [Rickettsiales bacterium]